jgi:predicted nucleic-acid-binding Zn-ribbon protein
MSLNAATCPKCGTINYQTKKADLPRFDTNTNIVTKLYICKQCGLEYFGKYALIYTGCEAIEDNTMVSYDAFMNKED